MNKIKKIPEIKNQVSSVKFKQDGKLVAYRCENYIIDGTTLKLFNVYEKQNSCLAMKSDDIFDYSTSYNHRAFSYYNIIESWEFFDVVISEIKLYNDIDSQYFRDNLYETVKQKTENEYGKALAYKQEELKILQQKIADTNTKISMMPTITQNKKLFGIF